MKKQRSLKARYLIRLPLDFGPSITFRSDDRDWSKKLAASWPNATVLDAEFMTLYVPRLKVWLDRGSRYPQSGQGGESDV